MVKAHMTPHEVPIVESVNVMRDEIELNCIFKTEVHIKKKLKEVKGI